MLMDDREYLKQQVKDRIRAKICTPYTNINDTDYAMNTKYAIEQTISNSLSQLKDDIIDAVVEEMYSDEKFESDIGLR